MNQQQLWKMRERAIHHNRLPVQQYGGDLPSFMPQQQQSYINQTQFSSNSNHMMSQKLISSQNLQYQLKEHIMQQQPKRSPNFHPVMAFQDEYQDDDEEEEENFEFKEPEQNSTALVPVNNSTETALAIPAKEIEIKGVHFKICAPNDAEQYFTIFDFQPHHKLKDLRQLVFLPAIRQSELFTFYFQGIRFRESLKLRDIQFLYQKNNKCLPILIYNKIRKFEDFDSTQLKDHFNVLVVPKDHAYYGDGVIKQKIEFEREKLRKLREVYMVAIDKTQNCRFFVRDFIEYIKKVLSLQLNVTKMSQEESLFLKEKGFASGKVEGVLFQKIEGIDRALFAVQIVRNIHEIEDLEACLLQSFLPLQLLNNKYRKELKRAYDITEEFDEELMNNKMYGVVTDGQEWKFMLYEHAFSQVIIKEVHTATVDAKDFFKSLHEVVKIVINLCADLIFNKFVQ